MPEVSGGFAAKRLQKALSDVKIPCYHPSRAYLHALKRDGATEPRAGGASAPYFVQIYVPERPALSKIYLKGKYEKLIFSRACGISA